MSMFIYKGNIGNTLEFKIFDEKDEINLEDAGVLVKFYNSGKIISKKATIGSDNKTCTLAITEDIYNHAGVYYVQCLVTFDNGNRYHTNKKQLLVKDPESSNW